MKRFRCGVASLICRQIGDSGGHFMLSAWVLGNNRLQSQQGRLELGLRLSDCFSDTRHWQTSLNFDGFVLTSVLTQAFFKPIFRGFTYEEKRGRESNPWHRRRDCLNGSDSGCSILALYERLCVLNLTRPAFAFCSCEYRSIRNTHVARDLAQSDAGCVGSTDFSPGFVRDCSPHSDER